MHRILIVHDVHKDTPQGRIGWAYWRRSQALVKYAPPDFLVETCQATETPYGRLHEYDLIFNLDYMSPGGRIRKHAGKAVLVVSYNKDRNSRLREWPNAYSQADFVIVNNWHMFDYVCKPPRTCCISNGVDTGIFRPTVPIVDREHRIFWRGSSKPVKGKGWTEVLEPAIPRLEELGFVCDFKPVDDIEPAAVLGTDALVAKYNECSYVVCASKTEGTPNTSLEGMSCGCVLVTTRVGNVLEFGRDGINCVEVERSTDALIDGLVHAREHREQLSAAGIETMQRWSYGPPGNRAAYFFAVFRALIAGRVPEPFIYSSISPEEI